MVRFLLDTDVLVEYLRGTDSAVELVNRLYRSGNVLATCCINIAEVFSGLSERHVEAASKLMDGLAYLDITREASRLAGFYRYSFARQGVQLSTTDAIIAATAMKHSATLITGNRRHYPMEELPVITLEK